MRVLAPAIIFLISSLNAQGTSITAQWSADTVLVGQPVRLRLAVRLEPGAVPHFPQLEISDPAVTLVSTKLEPLAAEYVFTFWEMGWAVLPGIPVKYLLSDGTEHILQTDSLAVFVATTLTGQEQDIRGIKSMLPVILTDPEARLYRAIVLVLLLGLIALIWRRRRRFPKAVTRWKKIYPDRAALEELTRLRRHMFEPNLADKHYLELSRILRHYLERRYLFRALEMTTSEIELVLSVEVGDPEIATLIGQVLELSDLVKFAGRSQDQHQWAYDLELVESIIRRTRPAFQV